MIIDVHTHIFPSETADKTLSSLRERAEISYYTDGTVMGLTSSMEDAGIDVSVISRITTNPDQVGSVNKWLKSVSTEKIRAFATIHPDMSTDPEIIKSMKKDGFKGIKVHPDYQGFYVDEMRMYPFYETAQAEGMPILFHTGLDRGLPPPLHAPPERIYSLLKDFPRLNIIAAHMGGEDNYEETEKLLLGSNIYLDTSFVLRIMSSDILKRFVSKHPVERILFGSDSPWKNQSRELEYLFTLPFLSDDAKEKIAGANAARLLGF